LFFVCLLCVFYSLIQTIDEMKYKEYFIQDARAACRDETSEE